MWQKNGKGPVYYSRMVKDPDGGRHLVLVTVFKNGNTDSKSAESWQMLVKAGWKKVR